MSEILKSKHAFGSESGVSKALKDGLIDAYDILFLDEKKIGWITKNGEVVIAEPDLTEIEAQLANKASAEEVNAVVAQIVEKISLKANSDDVDEKINDMATDTVAFAKAYTDEKFEAAIGEHMKKKFEITDVPEGTLVDYRDKEIRVMCPADTKWEKQNVGVGGDANCYYATFKTYIFDDDVVGYIEHLGNEVDREIITTFSTDEYGHRYQVTWLALAKYDDATGTWTYYGKSSSVSKYIGWDYQIDWYNSKGMVVASDTVRINLSNEQCHSSIEPYYVSNIVKEIDTKIHESIEEKMQESIDEKINESVEEKLKEVESSYEVIEF